MEKTTRGELQCITYTRGNERWESENRVDRINKAMGISRPRPGIAFVNLDHGQESPHAFLDVSHLTSAT